MNATTPTYILFAKKVDVGSILHKLCEKYYGDFCKFEAEFAVLPAGTEESCLMHDIREAFWCNEFRTEDVELRRKVLYDNYYCVMPEPVPL